MEQVFKMFHFVKFSIFILILILLVDPIINVNSTYPNQSANGDSKNISDQTASITLKYSNVVEGGLVHLDENKDHTHIRREHINDGSISKSVNSKSINNSSSPVPLVTSKSSAQANSSDKITKLDKSTKINTSKSVNTAGNDKQNGTSNTIKLTLNNSTSATKFTPTTKPKPTKPMRTVHDYSFISKNTEEHTPNLPNRETYYEKKSKRADYVVPIIAVIFSVPLVAIIISVLYKRGTDWWQHRNYRRMDFLIEGMYNT